MEASTLRTSLGSARRVVVKIGSRVLVQKTGRPDKRRMRELVRQVAALVREGREVVVVSSGAIGSGMEALAHGDAEAARESEEKAGASDDRAPRLSHLFSRRGPCRRPRRTDAGASARRPEPSQSSSSGTPCMSSNSWFSPPMLQTKA